MNEFLAKKLGEVLAFERQGVQLFERGQKSLGPHINEIPKLIETMKENIAKIETLATNLGVGEVTLAKAEATGTKLVSMRDMYLQNRWDDAAELMEWLGFFEGAAVVHWSLVAGGAESLKLDQVKEMASSSMQSHKKLIDSVSQSIAKYASVKSK